MGKKIKAQIEDLSNLVLNKPLNKFTSEECRAFIEHSIAEADRNTLRKLELVNKWRELEDNWANAWFHKEQEYWNKFAKIVSRENTFFKVDHVNKLGLKYDILIFLGKKNIGKSCEIYRLIWECIQRGKKFIYIRLSKDEITKSREAFNHDEFSPVYLVVDKNVWVFYSKAALKEHIERETTTELGKKLSASWIRGKGVEPVGYAYEFKFCQSYTGGQYSDFDTVFYDECLSYTPQKVITENHMHNWAAFLSSIARNKPELKVFLFGNLLGTNADILTFYGIARDERFRYIARGGVEDGCRILFINGGDLYKGYESQTRAAKHAGGIYALRLQENAMLVTSTKIIPPQAFYMYTNYVYFVFDGWLINLRYFNSPEGKRWAVQIGLLNGFEDFSPYKIFTSNKFDLIKYSNLTFKPSIAPYLEKLLFAIHWNKIRFLDEQTLTEAENIYLQDPLDLKLDFAMTDRH